MGAFGGLIMTNKGRALQAKAQTGVQLTYTRIAVGDGTLSGQSILDLNSLISQKKSLSITKLKTQPEGKAVIGAVLSNQDIAAGFYFRELGVFAQDPDAGEILYCYANAGANAEYIPAGGGPDIVEKSIDVITIVGNAANVNAVIDTSLVWATQTELQAVISDLDVVEQTLANKVDKVIGKGLSTNDYTDAEKQKVELFIKEFSGSFVAAPGGTAGFQFTSTGLTASYTAGIGYVAGHRFDVAAGSITLNATQGQYIYLDVDGVIKNTTDQVITDAALLLWYFATDATTVTTSTDRRNILNLDSMTIDPTQVPTGNTGKWKQFFSWFANRIKAITGKTNWWDAPRTTLENAVKRDGDTITGSTAIKVPKEQEIFNIIAQNADGTDFGVFRFVPNDTTRLYDWIQSKNKMALGGIGGAILPELRVLANSLKVETSNGPGDILSMSAPFLTAVTGPASSVAGVVKELQVDPVYPKTWTMLLFITSISADQTTPAIWAISKGGGANVVKVTKLVGTRSDVNFIAEPTVTFNSTTGRLQINQVASGSNSGVVTYAMWFRFVPLSGNPTAPAWV